MLKEEVTKETELESPDQPDQPSTTERIPSTSVVEEKDNEPDHSVVLDESGKLEELRQALQQAEQQNQLLNSEYSKLLREKEVGTMINLCLLVTAVHLEDSLIV